MMKDMEEREARLRALHEDAQREAARATDEAQRAREGQDREVFVGPDIKRMIMMSYSLSRECRGREKKRKERRWVPQ